MRLRDDCQREMFPGFDARATSSTPALVPDTPDWLTAKLAAEDADERALDGILARLTPRRGRLIVTKPEVAALATEHRLASGLHVPDIATRNLREFGLRTTVLRVHPGDADDLALEGVLAGSTIVIPEYAGTPLFLGRDTPWWIIGLTDVMCVIHEGHPHADQAT